jgi:RNA polymerase sigma factor (sigma-70 family)
MSGHRDFARVYDEHVWRVYGFFGYHLGSRADVDDLTQLTFERALRAWHRFDRRRASTGTWLMSIARNLLIDHYRRDRSGVQEPLEDAEGRRELTDRDADPSDMGISPDLEAALETLDERQRELIALRYGGEMTGPEIAKLTGLSLANVQQILSRALRKLRSELEEEGGSSTLGRERAGTGNSG